MNENINLCEILKDCPKGTKLYSPITGIVEFQDIRGGKPYPIIVSPSGGGCYYFTKEGKFIDSKYGECLLFPSKDVRTWEGWQCPKPKKPKFDPKTLNPYDKVLVRCENIYNWNCSLFSNIDDQCKNYPFGCLGSYYRFCIPYNEDTKHLVGTTDEAPEFYRYWED